MKRIRFKLMALVLMAFAFVPALSSSAWAAGQPPEYVLKNWYKLILELVRHTPTYSPPVASRAFAYLGITTFEATASGDDKMVSLAGQLNGLEALPRREAGKDYDEAVLLNAAMTLAAQSYFTHTGPTGQRALAAMSKKMRAKVTDGVDGEIVIRSEDYGKSVAAHILAWSQGDGGAKIENMGFPLEYKLTPGPTGCRPARSPNSRSLFCPNGARRGRLPCRMARHAPCRRRQTIARTRIRSSTSRRWRFMRRSTI